MAKFIFITGGVVSSLGKGITAAALYVAARTLHRVHTLLPGHMVASASKKTLSRSAGIVTGPMTKARHTNGTKPLFGDT